MKELSMRFTLLFSIIMSTLCVLPLPLHAEDSTSITPSNPSTEVFTLDSLNDQEKKAAGLDKLSPEEQEKLQNIINSEIERKEHDDKKSIASELTVLDILNNGKKVILSDGSIFIVTGHSIKKTAKWNKSDIVEVESTRKDDVFKLINKTKDDEVKGRKSEDK